MIMSVGILPLNEGVFGHHWPICSQNSLNAIAAGRSTRIDLRIVIASPPRSQPSAASWLLGEGLECIQGLVPELADALDVLPDLGQALRVGEAIPHLPPFRDRRDQPG